VFVRKGLAPEAITWKLAPVIRTVGSVLDHTDEYTPIDGIDKTLNKFIRKLSEGPCVCGAVHGFDVDKLRSVGLAHQDSYKRAGFAKLITPEFFPDLDFHVVCRKHVSPFTSGQPSVLAEYGFTPVLLGSSLWIYRGKTVSKQGYCGIMGFPQDYIFPPDKHYGIRTFLSKGVCPPRATWVLDNLRQHLGLDAGSPLTRDGGYVKICAPGKIVSFRPSRNEILERLSIMHELGSHEDNELVPLRDEEDNLMDEGDEGTVETTTVG
jgi:hypothetical protein